MRDPLKYELGRFGQPATLILIALLRGPSHGYALMSEIEVEMDFKIGPGTFYAAIAKLLDRGLISRRPGDDRTKTYEITDVGRDAVAEFVNRWSKIVEIGQLRLA